MEVKHVESDDLAQLEGVLLVKDPRVGILVLHAFQELAGPDAGVLISHLGHHDGVIGAEEGNDEFPVIVVGSLADQTGFESQNILIVRKEFLDIFFGRLGIEAEHVAETVNLGTVAIVRGDGVFVVQLAFSLHSEGLLLKTHVGAVPVAGERIAVIDEALTGVEADIAATDEIGRREELFLLEGHAGVVGVNGDLGELAATEEDGEGVFSIVLNDFFFDFNSIVC